MKGKPVTPDEVAARIASLGPLSNVFLVGGSIALWFPEIGLRYLIIEWDELAEACRDYLRAAGVRHFESCSELQEALRAEKWEGWDTCADWRRIAKEMERLRSRVTGEQPESSG